MLLLLSSLVHAAPCAQTTTPDGPPAVVPASELAERIATKKGCVVLVELYASWCGPCATIDPAVTALVEKHRPAGLTTLGLSVDTNRGAWLKWREQHARIYDPLQLTDWTLDGLTQTFAGLGATFESAVPFFVLLDAEGAVVMSASEPTDLDAMDARIAGLLASQ